MARCRVFVSSTFYDLKYIRSAIEQFIVQMGYDPVLFEKGDIAFMHDKALEESCYHEIELCDIFVMVIGGRYGAISDSHRSTGNGEKEQDIVSRFKSITEREYEQARKKDIPIYIFVEAGVYSEYNTFQKNRDKEINYAFVDDRRVFELIESILKEKRNNLVREFHRVEDITNWLRDQWSGVFSDLMRNKTQGQRIQELQTQVAELSSIVGSLRSYSEQIIMAMKGAEADPIIKKENQKLLKNLISIAADSYVLPSYIADDTRSKIKNKEDVVKEILESNSYDHFVDKITDDKGFSEGLLQWGSSEGPRGEYNDIREFLTSDGATSRRSLSPRKHLSRGKNAE